MSKVSKMVLNMNNWSKASKEVQNMYKHVFAHNFLNIQRIFNPKKVLESWDLGLFNHSIKSCVYWRLLRSPTSPTYIVLQPIGLLDISPTCFHIHSPVSQLSKTFSGLKIRWILRKLWQKRIWQQQCYLCLMSKTSEMWYSSIKDQRQHCTEQCTHVGDVGDISILWIYCIEIFHKYFTSSNYIVYHNSNYSN